MEELRNLIGVSFKEIEEILWAAMRQEFTKAFVTVLEMLDNMLKEHIAPDVYEVKGMESRGIVTLLGSDVSFKRRRYLNKATGQYIYMLDEVLNLPERERISPGMKALMLNQAVTTDSYRKAAESIRSLIGYSAVSHETIRQVVKSVGMGVEAAVKESLEEPKGRRKVRILFIEADGLNIPLQCAGKSRIEEKVFTLHEGWEPRYSGSSEYRLIGLKQFRTNGDDFWEEASRFAYSHYDIDEETIVVINGDRASWIRKGIEYFPNAMYQIDRWHLKRDLHHLFRDYPKVLKKVFSALETAGMTGTAFFVEFTEGIKLLESERRREGEKILGDLLTMPEAVMDYRERLKARGVCVEGLRGLGAAEGQMDRFSDRMKRGRSWSIEGEAAMMEILCVRHSGYFSELIGRLEDWCEKQLKAPISIKALAKRAAESVLHKLGGIMEARTPIINAGINASGGLSKLIQCINNSGLPVGC